MRYLLVCLALTGCGQPLVGGSPDLFEGHFVGTSETRVTDCDTGALLGDTTSDVDVVISRDDHGTLSFEGRCHVTLLPTTDTHAGVMLGACNTATTMGSLTGGHLDVNESTLSLEYDVQSENSMGCVDAVITINATRE